MDLGKYFEVVDQKIIPEYERKSKYKALIDRAKKLSGTECLQVTENKNISVTAIMSLMRKEGYKVTQRTVDNKKNLYIYKKAEAPTTPEA